MARTLLVVDDDRDFIDGLVDVLGNDYRVDAAASGRACLELVRKSAFDLILLDLRLPDMGGLTVLRRMRESGHSVPVIVITAYGGVESAVSAIRLGAVDYIEKPLDGERLKKTLRDRLARRQRVCDPPIRRRIIGECPQMRRVWQAIERFGATDIPIFLQGETGTGKELFARAIHEVSMRSAGPFVTVDCATLAESLIDSELFGYEKGAFTGAAGSKLGRLEWADGGTLVLDEISELPLPCQAKLLRAVEERTITPLGARRPPLKRLDVRFISATNRNLRETVERREFREDLFYRLAGVVIELPPLRERGEDVERLIRHFLHEYREIHRKPGLEVSPDALEALRIYWWPGNVRELQHVMRAAVAAAETLVLPRHLPGYVRRNYRAITLPRGDDDTRPRVCATLDYDLSGPIDVKKLKAEIARQAEIQVVAAARNVCRGDRAELARFLGIDPKTLRRILRELDRGRHGAEHRLTPRPASPSLGTLP